MDGFKKIVLYSAIIILIISLVLIGIALSYSKNESWPPMVPKCPDYFVVDGTGKCLDILDIIPDGKKTVPGCIKVSEDAHFKRDFNTSEYTGTNGKCNKYKWADKCGVSWDGITYGAKNPCLT